MPGNEIDVTNDELLQKVLEVVDEGVRRGMSLRAAGVVTASSADFLVREMEQVVVDARGKKPLRRNP